MVDVGIIGGADGPTAVLVASSPVPLWLIGAGVLAAAAVVAALVIVLVKRK